MKKYLLLSIALTFVAFGISFYSVKQYSKQEIVLPNTNRAVASNTIDSNYEFQLFNNKIYQNEIVNQTELTASADSSEKFILLKGFSLSLCRSYSIIQLVFDAYGISTSGEPTQFKIKARCNNALDFNNLSSIRVPISEFKKQEVTASKITVMGTNETYQFTNMDSDWNKTWILTKIIFESESDRKIISLNDFENDRMNYKPIVLEF